MKLHLCSFLHLLNDFFRTISRNRIGRSNYLKKKKKKLVDFALLFKVLYGKLPKFHYGTTSFEATALDIMSLTFVG